MTRDEAVSELVALRHRRSLYALCVANPKPDRQHAFYDEARAALARYEHDDQRINRGRP